MRWGPCYQLSFAPKSKIYSIQIPAELKGNRAEDEQVILIFLKEVKSLLLILLTKSLEVQQFKN
jgi:hypothetical protein